MPSPANRDPEAARKRWDRDRSGFRTPAERAYYGIASPLGSDEEHRARDRALKDALNAVLEQPDEDWPEAAAFWRRALAFAIDMAVVLYPVATYASVGWAVVALFAYLWATNSIGRSVGKLLLGIKVIDDDKRRPGWRRGLIRTWLSTIDFFFLGLAVMAFGIGLLLIPKWVSEDGTIHDTLAMTEVVRAR